MRLRRQPPDPENLIRVMPAEGRSVTIDDFNACCRKLPHSHHVVQWGGAHVWKVATKVFALADAQPDGSVHVTFKCSPLSFDILKEQPGLRPAPYLASRGLKWIQRTSRASMSDKTLREYLRESHRLASLNLPKRVQKDLGLNQLAGMP